MNYLSSVHKRELKSEDLNQALSEIQLVLIHPAARGRRFNQDPMAPPSVRESSWVWALSRETLRQAVLWGQKFITRVIHAMEDSSK